MDLFHTSPAKIDKIHTSGRFGEFLFFSSDVYTMTATVPVVYRLDLADDQVIEAGRLFFHDDAEKLQPLVAELACRLCISEEDAEALMEEAKSAHDIDSIEPEDAADASWDVQLFTARAAKLLGFRAVQVQDEQGAAWMVDMLGREAELVAA
jgi:hypothetical protein